jgi:hypothetical protein
LTVYAHGCDYAFSHPTIPALKAAGLEFACRYLYPMSQTPGGKNLTRDEATTLNRELKHGVVSNYESWASRALEGHDAGVADARAGQAQHTACGGKLDRPLYYSVDFDPTSDQYDDIRAYFLGVSSVIGVPRTGAYGGYPVIKYLFDNRLIHLNTAIQKGWGWQTYAWSGGRYDERCVLSQDKNGVPLGGAEIDLDSAHALDFGQWNYTATMEDDMSAEAEAKINDLWNWFKGAKIPLGQANLGSTIAATLPVTQANHNKLNGITTQLASVPTEAQMAVALAKIPGNVRLTEEQIALLVALLGEDIEPAPPAA